MIKVKHEYRINKKGCECFRTYDAKIAYEKLHELQNKRPGIYTLQSRSLRLTRYGVPEPGQTWSPWL